MKDRLEDAAEKLFNQLKATGRLDEDTPQPIAWQAGDAEEAMRQMHKLIEAGMGDQRIEATRGDERFEGTAEEIFGLNVRRDLDATRDALDRLNAAPEGEAQVQAWLRKLAERAQSMRHMMFMQQPKFDREIAELDGQIARIASMTQEPTPDVRGAGKVRVLDERRVAREPGTEIRDFPLADKIARLAREQSPSFNADAREVIEHMTGKPLVKAIEEIMDASFPELMKAFYPRVYENTGRYHSPRSCAAMIANVVAEMLRYGFHRSATAYRLLAPGLHYLRERRMPMFFLAPDLLEAVLRTDFDDDIDWTDISLPYETGILILPKGALVHPEDGEVSMLIWSRVAQGEHPPPWLGLPRQVMASDSFIILGACPEKMIWYDSILTANVRPTMRLHNLFYRDPGQPVPAVKKSNFMDADLTEKDSDIVEKMGVIVFGTILAMNARPLLVEHGKLIKRVGKGDKAREFWSPNVIGAKYKFKREVPRVVAGKFVHAAGHEPGTHASPRMHWRRGHYRNQPVGPGRKERKTIWIEPCLIGAE